MMNANIYLILFVQNIDEDMGSISGSEDTSRQLKMPAKEAEIEQIDEGK
jgi:hypothetical protein